MLSKFFNWTVRMSPSQMLIVVSVTSGVVLLGVLAQYLKRRKSPRPANRRTRKLVGRRSRNSVRSPNGLCEASVISVVFLEFLGSLIDN